MLIFGFFIFKIPFLLLDVHHWT
uniref:Uncharacterized protein n=1 Tax=Lepeophtheirus salmonis TaxID=72036 RepID=A0A0K2V9E8_LEPSM